MFKTRHWAGHLKASELDDKKLFFWLFEPDLSDAQPNDKEIPLLIWLNGGPGCSSMDGLWLENGPFRLVRPKEVFQFNGSVSDDWRIELNPYSWHRSPAFVLYVDQPVGTGLSFTKSKTYCRNDEEVNIDFYYFLQEFLHTFSDVMVTGGSGPGRQMKRPLYFSGESHAGHYIPSMMDYILRQNDNLMTGTMSPQPSYHDVLVKLHGAAIGNGWVDPFYQYSAHKAAYGMALIDEAQFNALADSELECRAKLKDQQYSSGSCFRLLDTVISGSGGNDQYKVSSYDNRMWEESGKPREFPIGHKDVEAYLGNIHQNPRSRKPSAPWTINSETVLEAIHATESIMANQFFAECTDPPYDALSHQDGLGVVPEVVRILDYPGVGPEQTKVRMLFFNGVNDLICNHAGNEDFLSNLPWKGTKDWTLAPRYVWNSNKANGGRPVGYMKEHENLLFLKILNAGHMVPMDQPFVALQMMSTFMYKKSFSDADQGLSRSDSSVSCNCPKVDCSKDFHMENRSAGPMMPDTEANRSTAPVITGGNHAIGLAWSAALIASLALVSYAWRRRQRTFRGEPVASATDEDFEVEDTGLEVRYRDD